MSVIYGMHLGGVWGSDCQLEELLLLDFLANSDHLNVDKA